MNRTLSYIILLFLLLGMAACDTYKQDDYQPEIVVESYLVAGEPLPELRLSRTAPIDERYTFEDFAVTGADVRVNLLDASGAVEETYPYVQTDAGIYEAENTTDPVQHLRTYALEISVPGQEGVIRSSTFVPGPFELMAVNQDTIVYQSPEQLEARVTNSEYPGRASVYLFTLLAVDTTNYDLTPFYADVVDSDDGPEKEDFAVNSSNIVGEDNFIRNADGTLSLKLPWIAVAFYGPNEVVASALDDNIFDFKRSQTGGGTTSPGEMDNLIDHVEGGRGVFGSMARDQVTVFVKPRNGQP